MQSKQFPDLEQLADLSAMDSQGEKHLFATLWAKQRTVLVFIRHFG